MAQSEAEQKKLQKRQSKKEEEHLKQAIKISSQNAANQSVADYGLEDQERIARLSNNPPAMNPHYQDEGYFDSFFFDIFISVSKAVYKFFHNHFCNWFLIMCKKSDVHFFRLQTLIQFSSGLHN